MQLAAAVTPDVGGAFAPLPGLPEMFLYNAENVTVSGDGRIFATGSKGAYEIVAESNTAFRERKVDIVASGVPPECFKNGLAVHGAALYLGCSRVMPPFFLKQVDLTGVEQTVYNLLFVCSPIEALGQSTSWVVRANLGQRETVFDETIASIAGPCFANGLAIDERGANLYVANSLFGFAGCAIQRLATIAGGPVRGTWYHPFPYTFVMPPNGLKVCGDRVYFTCMRALPIPTASLEYVATDNPNLAHIVYTQTFPLGATGFDDFDIVDNGFVIANFVDWTFGSNTFGALRFISKDGRLEGTFRHPHLQNPSAIKVVTADGPGLRAGDVLVTDKTRHCLSRLQPDDKWREWLSVGR
jgi:hypothetical protein